MTSSRTGPWGYFWIRRRPKLGETPRDAVPAGLPLGDDLGEPPRAESLSHDDHEVQTGGQFLPQLPEGFAHDALGPVALHGVAHTARRGNP